MTLLPNAVGLGQPGGDFVINIINAPEPKRVEMISRRKGFDAPEARILEATREHDVPVHPISPNNERGETHAHLKGNPRFFGQDSDRTVLLRDRKQLVEDRPHARRFAAEVRGQRVAAARVRLITIGKLPAAIRAAPKPPKTRRL